ncbi:MAG: hypothetical protein LBB83_12420, partial [Treponema sp.]|jgi:hypothetical protein|nr:hypothetical protein [Treponema sp.]
VYKKEPSPDKIICAVDLLDYGTHPKEVFAWIREHKVDAVWRETTMSKPSRCTKAGSGVM